MPGLPRAKLTRQYKIQQNTVKTWDEMELICGRMSDSRQHSKASRSRELLAKRIPNTGSSDTACSFSKLGARPSHSTVDTVGGQKLMTRQVGDMYHSVSDVWVRLAVCVVKCLSGN